VAVRRPVKRWAAVAALFAALAYLLLSGGAVATQRAFVMAAVALGGVLVNRLPVSLRGLCLAACLVMLAAPESLLSAGFQMSFAATLALVAAYAAARQRGWLPHRAGFGRALGRYALALIATSAIAGLATAPFAAFHFGRLAPFGLIANLAAVPVMGFWVAPMLLLGGLLDTIGLGGSPLALAGLGIDTILGVAEFVAALPGAQRFVPAAPGWLLALIAAGGLWLCLRQQADRWLGAGALVLTVALWPGGGDPSERLLLSQGARTVALRGPAGLVPEHTRRETYIVERWLRRDGDPATVDDAAARPGWQQARVWLTATLSVGHHVALTRAPRLYAGEMARYCVPGSLIIAPRAVVNAHSDCTVLDRAALEALPASVVRLTAKGLAVEPATSDRRLWQQPRRGRLDTAQ
jgi:competence protein ComEC